MARYKREQIVDSKTGEVLFDRTKPMTMYLFSEERGYLLFHNRTTVKWYPSIEWPPSLSNKDLGHLHRLSACLTKENILMGKDGPLWAEGMGEVIGLSRSNIYPFVRKLVSLGMLKKTAKGYFMNPMYLFAGKYLTPDLYLLFRQELDPYIPEWVKKEIGAMHDGKRTEIDNREQLHVPPAESGPAGEVREAAQHGEGTGLSD